MPDAPYPAAVPFDAENQRLVANAHPPAWVNPEPAASYNLVVLGGGTAGLVAAAGAAGVGARVALVERKLLGGDCLTVGCVPSKALIRCARAAAEARGAGRFGVRVPDGVAVDFPALMGRMRRLRADLSPADSAETLRGKGVAVFLGDGAFTSRRTLEVGGKTLRFAKAVIATGSRPAVPDIDGLAGNGFLTNETVFSLTKLPARMAIVGGGPIGCELAQAFARFGSRVTLIQKGGRLMPHDDPDAAEIVRQALAADGVDLRFNTQPTRVQVVDNEKVLTLDDGTEVRADALLVAIGRTPNVDGFGLEAAGVAFDPEKGVTVSDRLRTTNGDIYAAGDCCLKYQFTHAADAAARLVIRNALFFGRGKVGDWAMPWCTYTDPEVAHVGLTAARAAERGIQIDTYAVQLETVDRAVLDGETAGFLKIHTRRGKGRIVGATLVAAHAGETISEITAVMVAGGGLGTLSSTIHPYPTQAEALRKAGDAYNKSRLSPLVKTAFGALLKWRR